MYREIGGLWLSYFRYEHADPEFVWTIRAFRALRQYCTEGQILVYFASTFRPYRNWVFSYGYRKKDGVSQARDTACSTELPGEHINLQVFGEEDPARTTWDDHKQYRGPKGVKGSAFTRSTSPAPPDENSLGPDPLGEQPSSSEESHTPPSPAVPPKAKARPMPGTQKPKEPSQPPPGWTPTLRAPDHIPAPRVTTSIASVPPPRTEGAAAKRSKV